MSLRLQQLGKVKTSSSANATKTSSFAKQQTRDFHCFRWRQAKCDGKEQEDLGHGFRQQFRSFGSDKFRGDHRFRGWGHGPFSMYDMVQGFQKPLESFFREMDRHKWEHATGHWHPKADVTETKDAFLIHVDLPGIAKEDVTINVEDNVLTISGERKADVTESEDNTFYKKERSEGSFTRRFSIPEDIDPKAVKANFKNGVLEIRIPRPVQQPKASNVEIKID